LPDPRRRVRGLPNREWHGNACLDNINRSNLERGACRDESIRIATWTTSQLRGTPERSNRAGSRRTRNPLGLQPHAHVRLCKAHDGIHHARGANVIIRLSRRPVPGCRSAGSQLAAWASANRNASHVDAPSPRCSYRTPAQAQQRKWGWPAPLHKADRSHLARCCASQAASVPVSQLHRHTPHITHPESLLRVISKTARERVTLSLTSRLLLVPSRHTSYLRPATCLTRVLRPLIYLAAYLQSPYPLACTTRDTHSRNHLHQSASSQQHHGIGADLQQRPAQRRQGVHPRQDLSSEMGAWCVLWTWSSS
jgi:hypothetical protein